MNRRLPTLLFPLEVTLAVVSVVFVYSQIMQYSFLFWEPFLSQPVGLFAVAIGLSGCGGIAIYGGARVIGRVNGMLWTGATALKLLWGLLLIVVGLSCLLFMLRGVGLWSIFERFNDI